MEGGTTSDDKANKDGNAGNKEGAILINEGKYTTYGDTVSGDATGEKEDRTNVNKINRNISVFPISCVVFTTTTTGKGVHVVTGVPFTKDGSETIDKNEYEVGEMPMIELATTSIKKYSSMSVCINQMKGDGESISEGITRSIATSDERKRIVYLQDKPAYQSLRQNIAVNGMFAITNSSHQQLGERNTACEARKTSETLKTTIETKSDKIAIATSNRARIPTGQSQRLA
jgi:UTP-glucose-1-phosphate uridylyltransferase